MRIYTISGMTVIEIVSSQLSLISVVLNAQSCPNCSANNELSTMAFMLHGFLLSENRMGTKTAPTNQFCLLLYTDTNHK